MDRREMLSAGFSAVVGASIALREGEAKVSSEGVPELYTAVVDVPGTGRLSDLTEEEIARELAMILKAHKRVLWVHADASRGVQVGLRIVSDR